MSSVTDDDYFLPDDLFQVAIILIKNFSHFSFLLISVFEKQFFYLYFNITQQNYINYFI